MRWLTVGLVFGLLLFFHTHGFLPHDEGWFLQGGLRILHGEVPYKDFEFYYNPGGLYVNALALKVLGESILASRIFALINSLLAAVIVYKLTGRRLAVLAFIFWGAGHINFVWPVMFCLTTGLANILFITKQNYFLAGLLAALTFVFKQNFGLAVLLANLLYVIKSRGLKDYFSGYLFVAVIQLAIFIATGSIFEYVRDFYDVTVNKIFLQGILTSPWPWQYSGSLLNHCLKLIFYLSPLIFVFLTKVSPLSVLVASFYIFSIRPTTDYIHLTPLIAIASVLAKWRLALLFLVAFGLYSSLFRNYYRWNPPLITQSEFVFHPKINIWVSAQDKKIIEEMISLPIPGKNIFIYSFSPSYYLILDKSNPTKYDYVRKGAIDNQAENNVLENLQKVKYLITDEDLGKNKIDLYIQKNFCPEKKIGPNMIWSRNACRLLSAASASRL